MTDYLQGAGLQPYLDQLGFQTVGYGCTTCIGNSGPLPEPIARADRRARARGRRGALRQPQLRGPRPPAGARQLPRLADAGRGVRARGPGRHRPDPRAARHRRTTASRSSSATSGPRPPEIARRPWRARSSPSSSRDAYAAVFDGRRDLARAPGARRAAATPGTPSSTYVQEPPFFADLPPSRAPLQDIDGARVLAVLGDSVTTDHISPAGAIPKNGPAAQYLCEHGVEQVGLEHLRRPARQPRSHDARHLRQRAHQEPRWCRTRKATGRCTSRAAR